MSFLYLLLGLSAAISISAVEFVSVLVGVSILLSSRQKLLLLLHEKHVLGALIFILLGVVSSCLSGSIPFLKSLSNQWPILFGIFLMSVSSENRASLLKGLLIGGVIVSFLAIVQKYSNLQFHPTENYISGPDFLLKFPSKLQHFFAQRALRSVGTRSHPLTFAETVMPIFLLFTFLWTKELKQSKSWINFFGFFICAIGLLFSSSRGVWLATAFGLLILFLGWNLKKKLVAVFIATVFIGVIFKFVPEYRNRALSIFSPSLGTSGDQVSKQTRFLLWHASTRAIAEKPVFGFGIKGARLIIDDPLTEEHKVWNECHNTFLQLIVDRGVLGFLIFVGLVLLLIIHCLRVSGEIRYILWALLMSFLLAGVTESWINDKEIAYLFWMFWGLSYSYIRTQERSS